jgi:ubiquitin-like 1-activating enzyme E1 B
VCLLHCVRVFSKVFSFSIRRAMNDRTNARRTQDVWSKDVPVHLDFMTAAANLRAHVFSIPTLSPFKVKEIAGNIIPAIATTNAIVAGLQVLQAFQLLQHRITSAVAAAAAAAPETGGEVAGGGSSSGGGGGGGRRVAPLGNCRYVFVQPQPNGMGRLLNPIPLQEPNPKCYVCASATAHVLLAIDTAKATLGDLVQDVLKRKLSFNKPYVCVRA